ncbi:lipopolysaccharide biosynthesis protein [Clostridium saccharobutylicum]|uniref:Membrane protein involved in the export of O-antigen and teichoic acid n=2 Tax=Clostridium saccharobutylicum TaxID=169679 RepID=U5MW07_CLOSA|nr:oligosaccharide flippase family protein [Clostridium saccharobutylicum]AGX43821.1 membrane protein involved in the export of O-antigen and teichoic acid [Clostridium saccharobutylicum DSM 13864]AQR91121.1 polysaccharide biosynthesis protein [Clostridium saccharobutylicum]AQS01025.1 polysaccharide biosynthesis protein [Clostridium saccharobutylicum]AQS10764.1 polysaccharide biosynthesis protein [Clostridium saccharobutylicum]AQS15008.1 polysaccharide biosynthesis protein [Clostridium sacchar
MGSKKSLIKNTVIIAIGKCSTQAISFCLLPLYTSILTEAAYGTFDFINTVVLFIVPFITLLMEEAMFRFLIDAESESEKKHIISQSVIFILINIIISSFVLYVILSLVKYEFKFYLIFFLITTILTSLTETLARGLSKIKFYSILGFFSGALIVTLNLIFIVYLQMGLIGLLTSYIVANVIISVLGLCKLKVWKYLSLKEVDFFKIKEMIKYSFPLVPNSISWVIINLSDRLVITTAIGAESNGIYAVANKFPNLINIFYGFFYTAWKEESAKAIKQEDVNAYYNIIYKDLKRFLMAISLCLISVLPLTFHLVINAKFGESFNYIPLLIVSMFFANISGFYGGIFSANKETKIMGISTVYAALINIVLNIIFIKLLGIYAAVLSTLISNLLTYIYRYVKLKKFILMEKDINFYITSFLILSVNMFCYYSNIYFLYLIGFIISFIYSVYINRNILKGIYNKLKTYRGELI